MRKYETTSVKVEEFVDKINNFLGQDGFVVFEDDSIQLWYYYSICAELKFVRTDPPEDYLDEQELKQ